MPFSATNPPPYPSGFSAGALGIPGLLIPIAGNPSTIDKIINSITDGVHGPLRRSSTPQNYYWNHAFKVQESDYSGYVMAQVGGDGLARQLRRPPRRHRRERVRQHADACPTGSPTRRHGHRPSA